ncbi:MAG: adenylate/guanylate cyclase domain-containing protein, partial [Clostridiales bacterium]|nr:adenylate/guanylate cyclase domain-containing protein [Clostridiales bacterium]
LHTGFYYYFDASNVYTHGAYNFVWYIFPMTPLLIQLLAIVVNYKRFPRIMRIPLVLFIVIPLLMAVAQFLVTDLAPGVISTVGMAIVLYVFSIEEMNKSIDRAHKREITMMAKYQKTLEDTVDLRTHELKVANEKVESLLLNILPENIARELAENPNKTISKTYPNATVLFADIVGFTQMSDKMTAEETVFMLNKMTILFDDRAKRAGVEKIKTIGDAYMAAAGLTEDDSDDGVELMIRFARGMIEDVEQVGREMGIPLKIRTGINSGELVAGVIGKTKFIYDVWGDTVNIASRMESTGDPMRIHLSEAAYSRISSSYPGLCSVPVDVKGKGTMNGYFL